MGFSTCHDTTHQNERCRILWQNRGALQLGSVQTALFVQLYKELQHPDALENDQRKRSGAHAIQTKNE